MKKKIILVYLFICFVWNKPNLISQNLTNEQLLELVLMDRLNYYFDSENIASGVSPDTVTLNNFDRKESAPIYRALKKSRISTRSNSLMRNKELLFLVSMDQEMGVNYVTIWGDQLFLHSKIYGPKVKIRKCNRRGLYRNISQKESYWYRLIDDWKIDEIHRRNKTQIILDGWYYVCSKVTFPEGIKPKITTTSFFSFQ